jgi:hypothetical protein
MATTPEATSAKIATPSGPTATATATVADGKISAIQLLNPGSGYTAAPTVSFVDAGGFGAFATAHVSVGKVTSIDVLSGGQGYDAATKVEIYLDGGPAFLHYAMLPSPSPLQASESAKSTPSTLTLVATNAGSEEVQIESIAVTLPGPSQNAQDLTDSFSGVGVLVPVDSNGNKLWTATQQTGGGTFLLQPIEAASGQVGANSLTFIFDNILVNETPGECPIAIVEAASTLAQPLGHRNAPPVLLQKWPSQFSVTGPTAQSLSVVYSGSTLVYWVVTGSGVTCTLSYDPDGKGVVTKPVANADSVTAGPLTNPNGVTFTIESSIVIPGQQNPFHTQNQVQVAVIPNPTIDFNIAANPVIPGQPLTFTLSWNLVDVSNFQITANDGPGGSVHTLPVPFSPKGTFVVQPAASTVDYVLQAIAD